MASIFADIPILANLAIFAAAAVVVWFTGTGLSGMADTIATRTSLSQAVVGLILLAAATSLPELATTVTASVTGHPTLAASNLLGGVVTQTAILAIADLSVINRSLIYLAARPVLLLEGLLLVFILSIVVVGATFARSLVLLNVDISTVLLFIVFIVAVVMIQRFNGEEHWRLVQPPRVEDDSDDQDRFRSWSLSRLYTFFALGAAVILVSGVVLTLTAEAIARQTGLGEAFIGVLLLALATSLPEVSTTIGAVRAGAYTMAVSNVFGSNMADTSLLAVADIAHRGGSIFESTGNAVPLLAAMGVLVTTLNLISIVSRENRVVLGVSVTAVATVAVYLVTMLMLYSIR